MLTPNWSSIIGLDRNVFRTRLQNHLGDASQLDDMNTWIDSNHTLYGL